MYYVCTVYTIKNIQSTCNLNIVFFQYSITHGFMVKIPSPFCFYVYTVNNENQQMPFLSFQWLNQYDYELLILLFRMVNYLTSLSKSKQEKVLKAMLQKKLLSKQKNRSAKTYRSIQILLEMNLSPLFQSCLKKTQMNYLNSAEISNSWWGNQTIL